MLAAGCYSPHRLITSPMPQPKIIPIKKYIQPAAAKRVAFISWTVLNTAGSTGQEGGTQQQCAQQTAGARSLPPSNPLGSLTQSLDVALVAVPPNVPHWHHVLPPCSGQQGEGQREVESAALGV